MASRRSIGGSRRRLGQGTHVVDVQAGEPVGDALRPAQAAIGAIGQEIAERLRRGGETARHPHAGASQLADHLAERGILAADRFDVGHAEFFERGDVHRRRQVAAAALAMLHWS